MRATLDTARLSGNPSRNSIASDTAYRRKRILLFLTISIGYLIVFFHRVAPAIMGPVIAKELGLFATDLGIMSSMYFWAQALGCIPAGLLCDILGPRKIIAAGLICAAAGTAVFVMAGGVPTLALGRFIIGLSVSVVFIGAMKIFSDWFFPNELATCSGVLLAVGNIGALLSTSPLIWLINQTGWRNAFWIIAVYTLFAGLLGWTVLLNKLKAVFSTKNFYLIALASTLYYGTLMTVGGLWAGPYLQDVYGLSKGMASSIVMCFTVGMILGCPISGWLSDKIIRSRKKVVCFACTKETTKSSYAATAVGGTNMGIALGAAFFQYVCGLIIDSYGKTGGVYEAEAYASAFRLCMCMMALSAVFMLFFKEKAH